MELKEVTGRLSLLLRGCSGCLRIGSAADKFVEMDRYVTWRLKRSCVIKRGRKLRAGQADRCASAWFHDRGPHKLVGTIWHPKAA